ncbi:hypothetical protein [Spirosoma telluris]|uniref:hypothetical protein n=1 Tax=Spirosoma telluris TaxID=2183553 RepID=UPI0038CD7D8C
MLSETVDAVVIGTGAGGAPLLARLAAAGLKVVALEAGKHWNPATDFATDEKSQEKLFWNDERLSAGNDPLPFGSNNSGTGVGDQRYIILPTHRAPNPMIFSSVPTLALVKTGLSVLTS